MRNARNLAFVAILILTLVATGEAQTTLTSDELSSPINPGSMFYRFRIGGVIGAGPAMQSGELKTTACDCPAFIDGAGHSLLVGAIGEYFFEKFVSVGVLITYDYRTIQSRYREYEAVPLKQSATGEIITQRVQFRHTADASVGAFSFNPFVKIQPISRVFLRTGPAINFGMTSNLTHQKELLDHTARLPNGEETELSLDRSDPRTISSTKAIIQDSELPLMKNPALYWNFAAGIDFRAGQTMIVAPVVQYSLPIGDLSGSGNAFRISNWSFIAEVKVKIH